MTAPIHAKTIDPTVAPIPLVREVGVELRKLVDTRAAWALVGTAVALGVLLAGIQMTVPTPTTFAESISPFSMVGKIFVGVLTIILVSGEWSRRTALSTFTLEPRRERVIAAKACAALIGALTTYLSVLVLAALVTAVRGGPFGGSAAALRASAVGMLFDVLMAFALALAVLNTVGAIVAYLVLPDVVMPLLVTVLALVVEGSGDKIGLASRLLGWVSPRRVLDALQAASPGATAWAQLLVCAVIWIGVPALIGIVRVMRSDVK